MKTGEKERVQSKVRSVSDSASAFWPRRRASGRKSIRFFRLELDLESKIETCRIPVCQNDCRFVASPGRPLNDNLHAHAGRVDREFLDNCAGWETGGHKLVECGPVSVVSV